MFYRFRFFSCKTQKGHEVSPNLRKARHHTIEGSDPPLTPGGFLKAVPGSHMFPAKIGCTTTKWGHREKIWDIIYIYMCVHRYRYNTNIDQQIITNYLHLSWGCPRYWWPPFHGTFIEEKRVDFAIMGFRRVAYAIRHHQQSEDHLFRCRDANNSGSKSVSQSGRCAPQIKKK